MISFLRECRLEKVYRGHTSTIKKYGEIERGNRSAFLLESAETIIMDIMEDNCDLYSYRNPEVNYDKTSGIDARRYVDYIIEKNPNWDMYDEYDFCNRYLTPTQKKIIIDGEVFATGRTIEEVKAEIARVKEEKETKARLREERLVDL